MIEKTESLQTARIPSFVYILIPAHYPEYKAFRLTGYACFCSSLFKADQIFQKVLAFAVSVMAVTIVTLMVVVYIIAVSPCL